MITKMLKLVVFVLVTGLTANFAQAAAWDDDIWDGSEDSLWTTDDNWEDGSAPGTGDKAIIGYPLVTQPTVVDGMIVSVPRIAIGEQAGGGLVGGRIAADGVSSLTVTGGSVTTTAAPIIIGHYEPVGSGTLTEGILYIEGGSVTTYNGFVLAMVDDTAGTIDMSGGTVTADSHGTEWNQQLTIGRRGIGTLNMSGGTINAANQMWLGSDPGATGIVNMTGGTINVTNGIYLCKNNSTSTEFHLDGGTVTAADLIMTSNGSLDFSGGTMILDGDKEATVQGYIDSGWITGHDGVATVEVNYDAGLDKTTIAADPDFNAPPMVDAGSRQSLLWPDNTAQLDATVTDDGKPTDPGAVTLTWSKLSGPGNVTFDPGTSVEDPTATFTVAGMYELQLSASDGEKDAYDVVTIYIRADNDPIAHWAFEATTGVDAFDSVNNNDGVLAGREPNWVSGWVGNNALEFYGETNPDINSYVDITADDAIDPNLNNLRYEISLSAWIKTTEVGTTIIADGDNTWRMGIRREPVGRLFFICNGPSGGDLNSVRVVNDDHWHHVAAVYDGVTASIYIDGVLDNSSEREGLININDLPVTIGARYDDATTVSHSFGGLMDDVRVYSFGLSDTQVADLAAMGDLIPIVDAGESQVFSMQDGYLQLDATVVDDGEPVDATLVWSKTSGPGDVDFTDTAIEDPCVAFSEAGTYVLRLTADDTMATVYDEVTITVEDPDCDDVIADGLLISSDISGPDGTPDCYVDLYDFAAMAGDWLRCNNPKDVGCESVY